MKSRRLLGIFVGLVAVLSGAIWLAVWLFSLGQPASGKFIVAVGASTPQIIADLSRQGFIRSQAAFRWSLRESGLADRLQPGTYDLSGVHRHAEIIDRLVSGGVNAQEFQLTLLEGWNLRDIQTALQKAGYERATELFLVTGVPARLSSVTEVAGLINDYSWLADHPAGVNLDGYLFPDTYRMYRDATPEEIVRKLLNNFARRVTAEMREEVARQGRSLFDVVMLASVVEREARGEDDQRRVADIFWRRLDEGMALQSCATVNYVTGNSRPAVTYEETQIDSPYNTYKYRGLPAGPIGNPGLQAIRAVIYPLPNDAVYFLNDDAGTVHYARTLEEHNLNKSRYLR